MQLDVSGRWACGLASRTSRRKAQSDQRHPAAAQHRGALRVARVHTRRCPHPGPTGDPNRGDLASGPSRRIDEHGRLADSRVQSSPQLPWRQLQPTGGPHHRKTTIGGYSTTLGLPDAPAGASRHSRSCWKSRSVHQTRPLTEPRVDLVTDSAPWPRDDWLVGAEGLEPPTSAL